MEFNSGFKGLICKGLKGHTAIQASRDFVEGLGNIRRKVSQNSQSQTEIWTRNLFSKRQESQSPEYRMRGALYPRPLHDLTKLWLWIGTTLCFLCKKTVTKRNCVYMSFNDAWRRCSISSRWNERS